MSDGLAIALLGAFITILTATVVPLMVGLNRRIRRLEHRDRLSWLYIRSLIDHAYRHAPGVPLPEPPEGWLGDPE
jgi:hypothetical protein